MAGIELDGANQKVVLDSDGDTYLEAATDDTIKVYVAGAHDATISANAINVLSGTTLTVDSGATITNSGTANGFGTDPDGAQVFNESSADVDFRIESNGNDHMLFVDGGNDHVMIGTSSDLGGVFGVNGDQENQGNFKIKHTGDAPRILRLDANRGAGGDSIGDIEFMWNGNINAKISGIAGPDTTNKDDAHLDFFTRTSGASIAQALRIDTSQDANFFGNIGIEDDKGILFGTGDDMYIGTNGGETELSIGKGSTTTGGTTGRLNFIPTTDGTYLDLFSTEGKGPAMGMLQDDGDDNDDYWRQGQGALDGDANISYTWGNYTSGSWVAKMRLSTGGILQHSGSHSASHGFDYAEYWPWKTELANDAKITETYGMTVVLDGATVRLAETGEEAKVIGVVRPNNTSTSTGGDAGLYYINKYERNVWGETQFEEYTQVTWEDTYNDIVIKHFYMKDRIPAKRIRHGAVQSQENWHTLESNFLKDSEGNFVTLVVPSTDAEKSAANYVEKTTYTKDKGEHKKDDKLMREKINSSYDFTKSKSYLGRDKRRKEWCIVGLMGQVEVRDSAIVPTSWTKMKNLETGIDLYYIK